MVRIGTAHYKDVRAARLAYEDRFEEACREGLIVIGKPTVSENEKLICDKWGRYFVEVQTL